MIDEIMQHLKFKNMAWFSNRLWMRCLIKPTGDNKQTIELSGEYQIKWQQIRNASEKYRYYLVEAQI